MITATLPLRTGETLTQATPLFRLSLAQTLKDIGACQRLRYLVFNCELHEGLTHSERSGLDCDRFDLICDHLMVHDSRTGQLVGTYRMQTGARAKSKLGYYSEELLTSRPLKAFALKFWS